MDEGSWNEQLAELGERICILGPSNSGKSTFAKAIGRKRGLSVVHLDQLHHLPNTEWQVRPSEEFLALHEQAIAGGRWVIDGNYSKCMPQRFRRATGLIHLDISTAASLLRYFRRTLFERDRPGALEGGPERITWEMIHHIAVVTPRNRRRYAVMFQDIDMPKVWLRSRRAIKAMLPKLGAGALAIVCDSVAAIGDEPLLYYGMHGAGRHAAGFLFDQRRAWATKARNTAFILV
jgi:adenylate kinase family enzyme